MSDPNLELLDILSERVDKIILWPAYIQNKRAVINIKNKDEKCFLWSTIVVLYFKDVKLCNQ